jgi:threonine dehydratase
LSCDLCRTQSSIKRHRWVLLEHQDQHRCEALITQHIDQRIDQSSANPAALVLTQQVNCVEFRIKIRERLSRSPAGDEAYYLAITFGDKDDAVTCDKLVLPPLRSRLSAKGFQKSVGDNPGVSAAPALHMNVRYASGIVELASPNQKVHLPESSMNQPSERLACLLGKFRYADLMMLPTMAQIHEAQTVLYRHMPPTPQYSWPLINQRLGTEVWIKHENHTPVGAFKLRGALVYLTWLKQTRHNLVGVVAATRGNHGQGVSMAARLMDLKAVIVVPHGNSKEKNRAMIAQGAELIEHGHDFQESLEFAATVAEERGFAMVDSFHERLVMGTATYALELFKAAPPLDRVYVPIGLGSSICGVSAARNALDLKTEIVGVVSSESPSYALSFRQQKIVEAPSNTKIADGLACRRPNPQAMEAIWENVSRIVEVTDAEIAEAMRVYYQDTHNLAEGAGAAALAAALQEELAGKNERIGIILTGGNVDCELYAEVLSGAI